jgi:uncharacterized membrane protein YagU involved in acid resistance
MAHIRVTEETTLSERMARGVVAGILAGVAFAAVVGWNVTAGDISIRTPFLAISTIVLGDHALNTGEADFAIGVMVHLAISILYGMAFALISSLLRTNGTVALVGALYGAAIYVLDFRVFAPLWFQTFENFDQSFQLLVHVLYGLVVSLAFYSSDVRRGEPFIKISGAGRTYPQSHRAGAGRWERHGEIR